MGEDDNVWNFGLFQRGVIKGASPILPSGLFFKVRIKSKIAILLMMQIHDAFSFVWFGWQRIHECIFSDDLVGRFKGESVAHRYRQHNQNHKTAEKY